MKPIEEKEILKILRSIRGQLEKQSDALVLLIRCLLHDPRSDVDVPDDPDLDSLVIIKSERVTKEPNLFKKYIG